MGALGIGALVVYLSNASWLVGGEGDRPVLLAHRGVHQTFNRQGVERDACTAEQIYPPLHDYIENTSRSIGAAFEHGADIVEIDVHPTTDGHFVVFHDWRLECRTNGEGVTREQTLSYLKTLDIGYGYTNDGGKTYPLRGKGIGLMPSLIEVLDDFREQRFLIHVKSNDPAEGEALGVVLRERPAEQLKKLMIYGSEIPTRRVLDLIPEMRGFTRQSVKSCFKRYLALGWLGYMPEACRNTVLVLPVNYAPYAWGWPRRFVARVQDAGSEVFVVGPLDRETGTSGNDDLGLLDSLPDGYSGGIWTDRIEMIGAALRANAQTRGDANG